MAQKTTIVWTSKKASAANAGCELERQTAKMERQGYELAGSTVAEAGRSKRSWILLGFLNFARGKQVQVTATYRLHLDPPAARPA